MSIKEKRFIKILSLVIVIFLCIQPISVIADDSFNELERASAQPRWSNVSGIQINLGTNNSKLSINIVVAGSSNASFTNGKVVVTKISGNGTGVVKTWNGLSSNMSIFRFNDNTLSYTTGTYEVSIDIIATKNGVSETVTASKTIRIS